MSSPNPAWKPGDKIDAPAGRMKVIDPETVGVPEIYKTLISALIPRPIAFVSTVSAAGLVNLAPFSFFCGVSSNPPCLAISIARKPGTGGEKKDTLRNIEETGEFVVNSANSWLVEPLVHCAAVYPYGVDEMAKVGLAPEPALKVRPPRVKESAIHYECKVEKLVEIGAGDEGSSTLVVGRIVMLHVAEAVIKDGRIDPMSLDPIARLGGPSYARLGEIFDIPIPKPLA